MNTITRILHRAVTAPFYRQHAGAFLFAFLLLFGIQPSMMAALQFQYAIIQSILTAQAFFLVAFGVWLLYTIKVIHFFYQSLRSGAYDFLFQLNATSRSNQLRCLFRVNLSLLAPPVVYSLVVFIISIKEQKITAGVFVLLTMLFLYLVSVTAFYYLLKKEKSLQQVTGKGFLPVPPNLVMFQLRFISGKLFIMLLIIKLISFSSLYLFVNTDNSVFEDRMLWLIFLTALTGHSFIVHRNFHFTENELSFYRNMPVKTIFIFLSLCFVYIILLIPEAWALKSLALVRYDYRDYAWMALGGPAYLVLIHSILYTEDMKMEEFLKLLFGLWIVFVLFSLSSSKWLIPLVGFGAGYVIFRMSYRNYENRLSHLD